MTGHSELSSNLQDFTTTLDLFISDLPEESHVVVAYSGGLDSTVLLHLLSQSDILKGRVSAHYVDHGIQPQLSADWGQHCQLICSQLGVQFKSTKLEISSVKREGIESVARRFRYKALTDELLGLNAVLVTGHHQRDQAETVLLNLMRGSGVSGLAAMPSCKLIRGGAAIGAGAVQHLRPLLHVPYELLVEYAEHFNLCWIEDPSNQSLVHRRNVIRQSVLPLLQKYWPSVEKTLARTADNMSEAQLLLDKMAQNTLGEQGAFSSYLDMTQLSSVEWVELKNCIRYWLFHHYQLVLSVQHYEWIKTVLKAGGESRQGRFSYQLGKGELRFFKQRFYYLSELPHPYSLGLSDAFGRLGHRDDLISLSQWSEAVTGQQVKAAYLSFDFGIDAENIDLYRIRSISQDDVIKRKKLKSFFQLSQIPVWERQVWPVLEFDGRLVSVLGCPDCLLDDALDTEQGFKQQDGLDLSRTSKISFSQLGLYELLRLG